MPPSRSKTKEFYTNPVVDVISIARALWINLKGGEIVAGGSGNLTSDDLGGWELAHCAFILTLPSLVDIISG